MLNSLLINVINLKLHSGFRQLKEKNKMNNAITAFKKIKC